MNYVYVTTTLNLKKSKEALFDFETCEEIVENLKDENY